MQTARRGRGDRRCTLKVARDLAAPAAIFTVPVMSHLSFNISDVAGKRPSISVCMAAYNGERFIVPQLQSILSQLADGDEVIVVDDASSDRTREVVRELQEEKIRLIEHDKNRGVSRTFEDAIQSACNDIIFLSDQDDLWVPTKVQTILQQFVANPELTLVATDAAIIDDQGALVLKSYFAGKGKFRPGLFANLLHNWYGGCTLAFRASIRRQILPLPHEYDVLHDIWIGVRNSLSHGHTVFIPESLVLNRRHATTATGRGKLTLWRRLRTRMHLLLAIAEFALRSRRNRNALP
jgi:glycosyltransferase involved in cell wall biosynthesis